MIVFKCLKCDSIISNEDNSFKPKFCECGSKYGIPTVYKKGFKQFKTDLFICSNCNHEENLTIDITKSLPNCSKCNSKISKKIDGPIKFNNYDRLNPKSDKYWKKHSSNAKIASVLLGDKDPY